MLPLLPLHPTMANTSATSGLVVHAGGGAGVAGVVVAGGGRVREAGTPPKAARASGATIENSRSLTFSDFFACPTRVASSTKVLPSMRAAYAVLVRVDVAVFPTYVLSARTVRRREAEEAPASGFAPARDDAALLVLAISAPASRAQPGAGRRWDWCDGARHRSRPPSRRPRATTCTERGTLPAARALPRRETPW